MYFVLSVEVECKRLHTAVVKEIAGPWTYIMAIGYSGGGNFDEFCGKFQWNSEADGFIGKFSNLYHDPDYWSQQIKGGKIEESEIPIDESDRLVIQKMVAQMWDELIYRNEKDNVALIRSALVDMLNSDQNIMSSDWDADVVDWVSNELWGLNYRFDW